MQVSLDTNVWIFGILNVDEFCEKILDEFEQKGLKKGDAEIGAFCEWRKIDILSFRQSGFSKSLAAGSTFSSYVSRGLL